MWRETGPVTSSASAWRGDHDVIAETLEIVIGIVERVDLDLAPDGLACFAGVIDIGRTHQPTVVGARKPKDLPMFHWINTVPGNLKTSFSGAYHSLDFGKYAERYLGGIAYRFNRRFDLQALPTRLLVAAVTCAPRPEPWIRRVAELPC